MKKLVLFSFLAFLFTQADAQWYKKAESVKGNGVLVTEDRDINAFHTIDVGGAVDVYVHHSTEHRVEVTTDENIVEYVKTEVKGDRLVIKTEANLRKYKQLIVNVYTPQLNRVEVSGATDMWIKDGFESDEFEISASGASNISAEGLSAKSIVAKASGATDITLSGSCEMIRVDASGSSDVVARSIESVMAKVHASGASDISISASKSIEGSLSGSSDLEYYGSPSRVEVSTSGASDVSKGE